MSSTLYLLSASQQGLRSLPFKTWMGSAHRGDHYRKVLRQSTPSLNYITAGASFPWTPRRTVRLDTVHATKTLRECEACLSSEASEHAPRDALNSIHGKYLRRIEEARSDPVPLSVITQHMRRCHMLKLLAVFTCQLCVQEKETFSFRSLGDLPLLTDSVRLRWPP
jgi:hypothetical protein